MARLNRLVRRAVRNLFRRKIYLAVSLAAISAAVAGLGRGAPAAQTLDDRDAPVPDAIAPLRSPTVCPDDFELMTQSLLRDLPNYANRVLARSARRTALTISEELRQEPPRPLISAYDLQTHIALAGQATYDEAIPGPRWDGPSPEDLANGGIRQIFFTTLERQYRGDRLTRLQHYHWAMIADTSQGWRLTGLFSRIGGYPANQPPSPFGETTYGDVGRAIDLWLRDCEAGAVEGNPAGSSGVEEES